MSFKKWLEGDQTPEKETKRRIPAGQAVGVVMTGDVQLPAVMQSAHNPEQPPPISGIDVLSFRRAVVSAKANPTFEAASAYRESGRQIEVVKSLPRGIEPSRGHRSRMFDPLSLVYATGFRDRRYSLTYDILRRTSYQLSLVGAIISTRVNQVATFAKPYRENRQVGFQIRPKNDEQVLTSEDKRTIKELEDFVLNCGWGDNPYSPYPRDDFGDFLKKVTRDSLTYDQACYEIVPDNEGRPFEFRAIDASTIRLAASYDGYRGDKARTFQSKEFTDR